MGTCVNIVYTKSGNGSVMYIQLQSMQCCQINVCWLPLLGTIGDCWWREVIIDLWYGNFHPVSLLGSARNIKQTWCQSHHWKLIRESIKLDGLCWGIKLIKVFGELLYGFFTASLRTGRKFLLQIRKGLRMIFFSLEALQTGSRCN